jgi:hypothetical protein
MNKITKLLLFVCGLTYSQNVTIFDAQNHRPIAFVNIQFNKNYGNYTNEKGIFTVNMSATDTLRLTHISYEDYIIKANDIKDTIIMLPKIMSLKEVVITKHESAPQYIDFPKKCRNISSFPLSSKSELVTLIIPNTTVIDATITKINFNFEKRRRTKENISFQTAFKINIYATNDKKEIKDKIYASEAILINPKKNNKIELNLEMENLEFAENGIFIGIEAIGAIDSQSNIIANDSNYIRAILTDKSIYEYSSISFLRYIFNQEQNLFPINDILTETSGAIMNRSLSFGLTIQK